MMKCDSRKRKSSSDVTAATFIILLLQTVAGFSQAFPDKVHSFVPGKNAGFGQGFFPGNVLGPPNGTSNAQVPNFSQADLVSLGTGGSIIMEFNTHKIVDLPGPDFTIFENPVQPSSHPEQTYADTAVVAVSEDAETWTTFPFDIVSTAPENLPLKANYLGLAGVQPTYSSPGNGISPFDPAVSGGDKFDLADLDIASIRFIRITDSGDERFAPSLDMHGDTVTDYGNLLDPDPTEPDAGVAAGFDLDAVAALHTEPWSQSAVVDWSTYD